MYVCREDRKCVGVACGLTVAVVLAGNGVSSEKNIPRYRSIRTTPVVDCIFLIFVLLLLIYVSVSDDGRIVSAENSRIRSSNVYYIIYEESCEKKDYSGVSSRVIITRVYIYFNNIFIPSLVRCVSDR